MWNALCHADRGDPLVATLCYARLSAVCPLSAVRLSSRSNPGVQHPILENIVVEIRKLGTGLTSPAPGRRGTNLVGRRSEMVRVHRRIRDIILFPILAPFPSPSPSGEPQLLSRPAPIPALSLSISLSLSLSPVAGQVLRPPASRIVPSQPIPLRLGSPTLQSHPLCLGAHTRLGGPSLRSTSSRSYKSRSRPPTASFPFFPPSSFFSVILSHQSVPQHCWSRQSLWVCRSTFNRNHFSPPQKNPY